MKKDNNLDPLLKKVAREGGTEAPYSGRYVTEMGAGTYNCAVCDNPLFSSEKKFETHLPGLKGWPSFEDALPGAVEFRPDDSAGMSRTEVVCSQCRSHLGHIFDDDKTETKTGKHYCINSVCLNLERRGDRGSANNA